MNDIAITLLILVAAIVLFVWNCISVSIIALLVAKVAEMELEAISARNAAAFSHHFAAGRWRGGVPPWGYKPERVDGEWRLVQDPEQVEVIHTFSYQE